MPLNKNDRDNVIRYCYRDIADHAWFAQEFDFIDDQAMRDRLVSKFQAARYIYKLGEALAVDGNRLHAHVKFQLVQYASIYEAVIIHLLWGRFAHRQEVIDMEFHLSYRLAGAFPKNISALTSENEPVHLCVQPKEKTSSFSIKFNDKVDCAVRIGFVEASIGEDIKTFYTLRNAIHLETAVKKEISYEIAQSQLAYQRMRPFIDRVKLHLEAEKRSADRAAADIAVAEVLNLDASPAPAGVASQEG